MEYISVIIDYIPFSFNGFKLALTTFLFGLFLDNTISINSKNKLIENNSKLLFKGYEKVFTNLCVLSPIFYYYLENYLITYNENSINFIKYFCLISTHSVGYYLGHLAMHKIKYIQPIHKFHHKFTTNLIPSIGNAVSASEFTLAYVSPFLIGSYLFDPNLQTLNLSIQTISFFNLIIHCNELKNLPYNKYFVSPNNHINHHRLNMGKNTYSAPIINLDTIIKKLK